MDLFVLLVGAVCALPILLGAILSLYAFGPSFGMVIVSIGVAIYFAIVRGRWAFKMSARWGLWRPTTLWVYSGVILFFVLFVAVAQKNTRIINNLAIA